MAAITTLVAIAAVAAAVGGSVLQARSASATKKQARDQAKDAAKAATAKTPSADTGAAVRLASSDRDRRRGRGSKARNQQVALGASPVGAASLGGL